MHSFGYAGVSRAWNEETKEFINNWYKERGIEYPSKAA
tara:strand:+ start:538 stop:651 length:114 start_codon:yes stop_codon:yes gene_type:complete